MKKRQRRRGTSRADDLLVSRGMAETTEEARAWIMAGIVVADDQRVSNPSDRVGATAVLRLKQQREHGFVSRGGVKLEHAIREFSLEVADRICMDVGASTGGFTDCLLKHGAERVYAVDVGYGQLAWSLRTNERVVVLERTHSRDLSRQLVPDEIDVLVGDVSFTSLLVVVPPLIEFLASSAVALFLIKPQFEARREEVQVGGVVSDAAVHERVCGEVAEAMEQLGFQVVGIVVSPILGPSGNKEFLIHARREREEQI